MRIFSFKNTTEDLTRTLYRGPELLLASGSILCLIISLGLTLLNDSPGVYRAAAW